MAPETYAKLKKQANTCRIWVAEFWRPKRKDSMSYEDMYMAAELIDLTIERYWQQGGIQAIQWDLPTTTLWNTSSLERGRM